MTRLHVHAIWLDSCRRSHNAAPLKHLLDNIVWHCLSGPHTRFSCRTAEVRRYAPGFSPIIGFADPLAPNLTALVPFCEAGEQFYCGGWSGAVPAGWQLEHESTAVKMLWQGAMPASDAAPDAVPLGPQHAAQAIELAAFTQPGPFGLRTLELGEYFGWFEGQRLVAMAGERMCAGPLREISGVCTHPEFQGRGYARRLMMKLLRRELLRDEVPFLHVLADNTVARGLYQSMGFAVYQEMVLRVIRPPSQPKGTFTEETETSF